MERRLEVERGKTDKAAEEGSKHKGRVEKLKEEKETLLAEKRQLKDMAKQADDRRKEVERLKCVFFFSPVCLSWFVLSFLLLNTARPLLLTTTII